MNYGAIRSILLSVMLLSASWAAFGAASGTAVSAILFASTAYFLVRESRWTRSVRIAAILLGLSALVGLVLPAAHSARETARSMQCMNNLKQIGLGVQNYWSMHDCYPLPCTRDKAGRPMHSWRFLILPYFTSWAVDYDLNEPWDSPGKRKTLAQHGHAYWCPTAHGWPTTTTNYVAVVGRRPAWRYVGANQKNLDSQPQKADTFLIVEMANSVIQWTEPKDIYLDDLPALRSLIANSPHRRNNGYFFRETPAMNAVLIDGDMMLMFPWNSTPSVLTSLTALLPPDAAKAPRSHDKDMFGGLYTEELLINWPHCVGLPVWIVSLGLLFYQVTCGRKSQREAATASR